MKLPRDVSGAQLTDAAAHHGLPRETLIEKLFSR